MTDSKRYANVAISGPMRRTFSYHLSEGMPEPELGQRLLVPFGKIKKVGFYLGEGAAIDGVRTKAISQRLDDRSWFPEELFKLCLWMADYYFANPADCLAAGLPALIKSTQSPDYYCSNQDDLKLQTILSDAPINGKKLSATAIRQIKQSGKNRLRELINRGTIRESWSREMPAQAKKLVGYKMLKPDLPDDFAKKIDLEPFDDIQSKADLLALGWSPHFLSKGIKLGLLEAVYENGDISILDFIQTRDGVADLDPNQEQQEILDQLIAQLGAGFKTFLLHGVTGSGKTLVYCKLASEVLKRGETVLILTPEITLSGTTLAYFRGFFGSRVTVLHSSMTDRERLKSWQGILSGEYPIVIGPRSALFAPLNNLGLIVVDEEHDASYKQDDPSPRFHGRDAAVMRGRLAGVPVVLGSATPALESYHNALEGRYELLKLTTRPSGSSLPEVKLIDMRQHKIAGDLPFMSLPLKQGVTERLKSEEQVILYLNRRGYSPYLRCKKCGFVPGCPKCNIKLTYHQSGRKLTCHYCDHHQFGPGECQNCKGLEFDFMGAGTQKVEESLPRLFKQAKAVRFDSDSASGRHRAHRILREFGEGKYNLLLGTQMVTKGLDLSGVTLVGVLAADFELDLPDFRASERTFSRLVQVAGRSGRREQPGEVLIQTQNPELPVIQEAAAQDYETFFKREIKSRQEYSYPPYARLVRILMSGPDQAATESALARFSRGLARIASESKLDIQLLGPVACPLSYLRGKYRHHLLIKTQSTKRLSALLTYWESAKPRFDLPSAIKLKIDIDPVDLF